MADPAQRRQWRFGRALPRLRLGQSELAVADLPAPAHRGRAVGRPPRRRHGLVVVRKRIADFGQGQVRAGEGDDRARRSRQCRTAGPRGLAQRRHVGRHRERGARSVRRAADGGRPQGADGLRCFTAPSRKPAACAPPSGSVRAMSRWPRRASRPTRNPPTSRRCSMRCRANCTATPATSSPGSSCCAAKRNSHEAAQLMLAAPKDPNRLHNLDEWWIERRLLARKMLDVGEHRTAYLIARDAALPSRDIYKTEQEFTAGWIALRFLNDPAVAAQHFARIGVGSVNPTALARAGYWQGRAAEAAGRAQEARAAYGRAAEQSTSYYGQLARAKLGLPQIELNGVPPAAAAGSNGWRSSAPCNCSTSSTSARSRSRFSPTWARTAIPMRWSASANSPRATATPAACCCSARPRSIAACRSISTPIRSTAFRRSSRSAPRSSRASSMRSRGRKAPSIRPWSRRRRPTG